MLQAAIASTVLDGEALQPGQRRPQAAQITPAVRPLRPKPSRRSPPALPPRRHARLGTCLRRPAYRRGAHAAWSSGRTRTLVIEGSVSHRREKRDQAQRHPQRAPAGAPAKTPHLPAGTVSPDATTTTPTGASPPVIALWLAEGVCATNACYRAATFCPDPSRSCVTDPSPVEFRQCDESRALQ
jgi:hypothetical protein